MYELNGTKRVTKKTEKVPCGDCVTTRYFHPTSGEMLRSNAAIAVDPLFMKSLTKVEERETNWP
jgi:hypothetical protein